MRIAFFSPVNPKPSGISDYCEALLPHLAARVQAIDLFIEDYTPSATFPSNVRVRLWREFEAEHARGAYDAVLYHMGNNEFHVYIYDLALRVPGVVVLHEFNLHYLAAHATVVRGDVDAYVAEAEYNSGAAAAERARRAQAGRDTPDYSRVPMSRRVIEASRGVIVHSEYVRGLLRQGGFTLPVRRIPHGVDTGPVDETRAREKLAARSGLVLSERHKIFGIFGFLKPYKRIHQSIRAFFRLQFEYPEARMILVGEEHPHYALRPLIDELQLNDLVRILGYLPLDQFVESLAAVDVCLNLRRPTAGETSGSFLRALALGKPTLISDLGAFSEIPDDVAIKIPVDEREEEWIYEYMKLLIKQPQLARAISERAREYARTECSWAHVADAYVEFLRECAESGKAGAPAAMPVPEKPRLAAPSITAGGILADPNGAPSEAELADYIMGFSHSSKLMEEYVLTHLQRLVYTLRVTPRGSEQDRVLEMGCYLQITPALRRYLHYGEVRGAYFGPAGETVHRSITSITGEVFGCDIDLFDAERDRYPYADGYFKTVLCCELIEHLAHDPMHMMCEINRITALGGFVVLTTPNIVSLRSVHAVLHGYHPELFPAYIRPEKDGTVDPRHSREYAPREIALMMEAAGFEVERLETADYGKPQPEWQQVRRLLEANGLPTELRGEMICCVARKTGPPRQRWPRELYYCKEPS